MADAIISRRAVLLGRLQKDGAVAEPPLHISSAVVSVLPHLREEVVRSLLSLGDVEIHHRSTSKIVIVMEGRDSGSLGGRLAEISGLPGVLSANMVYEQIDHAVEIGESE